MKNTDLGLSARLLFVVVAIATSFHSQQVVAQATRFAVDSYSLEHLSAWKYQPQSAPDGSQLHMFMGPQQNGAAAYCHTTQQSLLASLAPRLSQMTEKQRVEFFATANQDLLFSIYSNLPSAQGFRLIYAGPSVIGKAIPAFTADFIFKVPQGFVYRVRSHYTFWKSAQLSIWCQTVSRNEGSADNAFQSNLGNFQRFVASVAITP